MKLFVLLLSFNEIHARARKRREQYRPGDGPPFPTWWDYADDVYWGDFDGEWTEEGFDIAAATMNDLIGQECYQISINTKTIPRICAWKIQAVNLPNR